MINLTLRQLRYFEALTQHGHFGRAAEACSVTQPALSVQIKELEEALGVALFDRTGRQLRLTSFGETFARRARQVLRSVDELGDLARASRDGFSGRLRLGVIPTIAPYLLPQVVSQISSDYPDLDLSIRETQTQNLIRELHSGQLDTAIVALPVSEPDFMETPLFEEEFVLVRHKSDAHSPVPSPAMLREMQLLLLEEGHCFRDQALSFCNMSQKAPRELLDGSTLTTLVQMVGAGIGVTLIPDMAVPIETRSANVDVVRFEKPRPSRMIGMIWRRTNPLSKQLHEMAAKFGRL